MQSSIALEQALQAALHEVATTEARYRALFEGVADAILVADEVRSYVDGNGAATALLGYTHEELLALHVEDVVAAQATWTAAEYDRYMEEGHWRGELDLRRKDGQTVPVEAVATIVRLPDITLYLSVVRDISARRAVERQQQAFLGMITHELRTPLTALRGYADLMRRRGQYNAGAVSIIIDQAAQLDRLIGDLLDASRIDGELLRLERASMDMVALVHTVAEQAQAATSQHTIRVESPVSPLPGWWDRGRMEQVLRNLLTNAVKYAPDGGDIVVGVREDGNDARMTVTDQGIGLAPEAIPLLFGRFYRTPEGEASGATGLGLGLYISQALVEAHGGCIWAESAGPGQGTTIHVTLPIEPVPSGERVD